MRAATGSQWRSMSSGVTCALFGWLNTRRAADLQKIWQQCELAKCSQNFLLYFQPCAGSEPDCNCCLSNKCTYMQLRSPEVTRVNFHLSITQAISHTIIWL